MIALSGCARESATGKALAELNSCRLKGIEIEVRCGVLQVPERRVPAQRDAAPSDGAANVAETRSITLRFAVVPAVARNREPDPIFVLAGGPGQAATDIAGQVLPLFARLNKTRDLVFVDQRGTGGSNALQCDADDRAFAGGRLDQAIDPAALEARIAGCAAALAARADLTQYTTVAATDDLDSVREHLGYARINLWGASYGTRVALEYLRRFSEHVRTATLDGVAPAAMKLPLAFAVDAHVALGRLTNACAHDAACSKAYPKLVGDIDGLFARFDAGPVAATFPHPLDGISETTRITRDAWTAMLRTPLYTSLTASLLPRAITKAASGDYSTLAALTTFLSAGLVDRLALGMHLSVICAEDMADITRADLDAAHREAVASEFDSRPDRFAGAFYDQYRRLCAKWPSGRAPRDFFAPVHSDVPVLMLSGGIDPAAPPRHALEAGKGLTRVRYLVAPHVGHGVSSAGCAPELIEQFIRGADPEKIDGKCLAAIPRPAFFEPVVASRADGAAARLP